MITYTTKDGDTVDLIAWRHYGTTSGRVVEQILEENLNLAAQGPLLPAGLSVVLPVISAQAEVQPVRLWT